MIQAKELRIGNWIAIPESGIQAVVKTIDEKRFAIHIDNIDLSPGENVFEYSSAEPIHLTPEILKKCGFENRGHAWQHPTDNAGVLVSERLSAIKSEIRYEPLCLNLFKDGKFYVETYYSGIEIQSLHQLQNLYFALTGEELTYNP